jgi:hypothetical protein
MMGETIEGWVISKCEDWRDLMNIIDSGGVYGILLTVSVPLKDHVLFLLHYSKQLSLM